MHIFDNARLVIYRINRKGLEIFLLKPEAVGEDKWRIPKGMLKYKKEQATDNYIELEPFQTEQGETQPVFAMEADWHEIPSVRAIIKEDVRILKSTLHSLPLEKGTYITVKEVFKKMLPHEYKTIKELKDILFDRNQANSI